MLFGSSAIGGVVNVIDARIPRRVPDEAVHAEGMLTYGSAANERSVNGGLDVPIAGQFVVHLDGNYTNTDDLEIGGFVLTPRCASRRRRAPTRRSRSWPNCAAGCPTAPRRPRTSPPAPPGSTATTMSASRSTATTASTACRSAISLDPAVEAEAFGSISARPAIDGRAEIDTGDGFVDPVRLRAAHSDYRHFELEESGEIATTFNNDGSRPARGGPVEPGGWGGGFGAQYFAATSRSSGEEKFLPPIHTSQFGLFALQTYDVGAFRAEAGARYEHSRVRAEADADLGNPALRSGLRRLHRLGRRGFELARRSASAST